MYTNMASQKKLVFVQQTDAFNIAEIDRQSRYGLGIGLTKKDLIGTYFSDYVRKLPVCGTAYCTVCRKTLNYRERGMAALKDHSKTSMHKKNRYL